MSDTEDGKVPAPKTEAQTVFSSMSFNQLLNSALSALAQTLVIGLPIGDQIPLGDRELIRQKWELIQFEISETINSKRSELETYISTIRASPGLHSTDNHSSGSYDIDNHSSGSYDTDMGNIIATAVRHKEEENKETPSTDTSLQTDTSPTDPEKIHDSVPFAAGTSKPLKSSLAKPKAGNSKEGSVGPDNTRSKSPKRVMFALETSNPQPPNKSNLGLRISLGENQLSNAIVNLPDTQSNDSNSASEGDKDEHLSPKNLIDNTPEKESLEKVVGEPDIVAEDNKQNHMADLVNQQKSSVTYEPLNSYDYSKNNKFADSDEDGIFDLDEELEYSIDQQKISSDDECDPSNRFTDEDDNSTTKATTMSASLPAVVGSFRPRSISKYIPEFQVPQLTNDKAIPKSGTTLLNTREKKNDSLVSIYSTSAPLEIMKPRLNSPQEVDTDVIDKSYSETNEIGKILVDEECVEGEEGELLLLKKLEDNFKKGAMSFTERLTFETVMQKLHDS
ncbi:hypothetical protein NADFUDRAFT_40574 [Nadsonia fulvescens var. elongata DSM 6958]|uniref:Uncharacterized protein n=1 Tax=Nadsonia fulvescens var. elongata DSM 6958 TaxID=857566 RepID=A0A1E3PQ90_9ASCO|nr:hypothetical protein NADFUDRAFT_40574 [Nadsonia fulvescens var. elongata DSM 6958]